MSLLERKDKYEFYWNILQINHEMIRFSEVKAGFVVSFVGVLFSILFQSIDKVRVVMGSNIIVTILGVIFILLAIAAFVYAFLCFVPRFHNKNPTSIVYFGDIVNDFEHYENYFEYLNNIIKKDDEITMQLAEQIHTNASIATLKFKTVSKSIRLLLLAVMMMILLFLVMLVM